MSNIVGEPFEQYVAKQIIARQNIHGKSSRTSSDLIYLNSNSSFIKLTSGVKIVEDFRLNQLGIPVSYKDSELAKNFILFSGVSNVENKLFSGLSRTETFINQFTYGLGGNEFGLRPMPGIISIETKYRNRGSIKEGTIQLKAYNRKQFEIISMLYLRVGFPVLLEWGHTIIVDNGGVINTQPNFSIADKFLDKKFTTDNEVLKAIEEKRQESFGNYNAMYGRVVNFNWVFEKDSSYSITLKIISVGAVVESLKMNVYKGAPKKFDSSPTPSDSSSSPQSDNEWVVKYKNSNSIGNWLFNNIQSFKSRANTKTNLTFIETDGNIDFLRLRGGKNHYVRLGRLLKELEEDMLHSINSNKTSPLIKIDYDKETNFMYTENFQLSSNSEICVVGGFEIDAETKGVVQIFPGLTNTNRFKTKKEGVLVGLPMNIYVKFSTILQKLDNLKDDDGNITLDQFINSLLVDINNALGGINQLEFVIDENVGKIIDQTPIPGLEKLIKNKEVSPVFNVLGYYNYNSPSSSAGFIREYSFKTELTNASMAMMTIGATANKSVVGEDATAMSKWNNGLLPIINQNIDYKTSAKPGDTISSKISKLQKDNEGLTLEYYRYLSDLNRDVDVKLVSNYINFNRQIKNILNEGKFVSPTSSRGFLPINLSFTMDGLSGIKIYQKIEVDTSFLPYEYPTSLKFIIKGIIDKVDKKGWFTSIETISVPIIESSADANKSGQNQNNISETAPNSDNRAESRNTNAINLRNTLTELGYKEKGKEIDSSGDDISKNIEKAASSLFRTIKKELPLIQVTVTGGNDKYHKNLSGVSRHKAGNSIDFTIAPKTEANLDKIVNILQRYAAGDPNFRFIDEYRKLSTNGNGNHFHISYGAGTEGLTESNKAIQLAQQEKITPIKIT